MDNSAANTASIAELEKQWPIIGQAEIVQEIRAHFRSTDPPSFAVLGTSGTGKTTLLRSVAKEARSAGIDVVAIHGVQSNPSIALAPLLPLLPPDAPVDADDGTLYRLLVSQLTRSEPRLITVDDAHLLDRASAAAVNAIALSRSALMVVNARSDLPLPPPILSLLKDGVSNRIDLAPLDHVEMTRALEQLFGAVDQLVVDQAAALSQGSPLFLHELVLDAVESGALIRDSERWQLVSPLSGSQRVEEVVSRRLEALTDAQIDALSALALREQLGTNTLEALVPRAVLLGLEQRGLTRTRLDGRRKGVVLGHPLYAQALRDRLSSRRKQRLLTSIADAISNSGERRVTDSLVMAMCRIEADQEVDPEELHRASERAVALYDYELAVSLSRAGFDRGHHASGLSLYRALNGLRRHAEADLLHAELLTTAGSPNERALAHLAAAVGLLQQRDDVDKAIEHRAAGLAENPTPETRLQLAIHELMTTFLAGDNTSAARILATLPELSKLPPAAAAALASHAAGVELLRGHFDSALGHVQKLRSLEQSMGRVGWLDRERTDFTEVAAHTWRFDPHEGQRLALSSVASAQALSVEGASVTLLGEQFAYWLGGNIGRAWATYEHWVQVVVQSTDRLTEGAGHMFGALTAFDHGMPDDFAICQQRFETAHLTMNTEPTHAVMHSRRHQLDGDLDAAQAVLEDSLPKSIANSGYALGSLAARELILVGAYDSAAAFLREITEATPPGWVAGWWLELAEAVGAENKPALLTLAKKFSEADYWLDAAHTAGFAAALTPSALESFILLTRARTWLDQGQAVSAVVELVEPPVSAREGEILLAASRGLTNQQISDHFIISPRTTANHLYRGYQKLGLTRDDLAEAFAEFRPVGDD